MKIHRLIVFILLCQYCIVVCAQNPSINSTKNNDDIHDFLGGPTFTVNSVADVSDDNIGDGQCDTGNTVSGLPECTLRAAIEEVNQSASPSMIHFNITGCVDDVCVLSPDRVTNGNWPDIVKPVTIDGSTQPSNASVCSQAIENRSVYKVVLAGDGVDIGLRLELGSDGSIIKGLNVRDFFNNIAIINSDNNHVECNFIGTDETGIAATTTNNANGIIIGCGAIDNIIGGQNLVDGNLISGNADDGIQFFTGFNCSVGTNIPSNNSILGNYIGVNKLMTEKIGNGLAGISMFGSRVVQNIVIGRITNTQIRNPNVIGGNESGVYIDDEATNTIIVGNYLGTDKTGTVDLGNEFGGVDIVSGIQNTVGTAFIDDANVIAYNSQGVFISGLTSVSNSVIGNSFYNNLTQSIDIVIDGSINADGLNVNDQGDLDTGANTLINQVDLLSAQLINFDPRFGTEPTVAIELLHDGEGGPDYSIDFDAYFSPVGDGHQGRFYLGSSLNEYNTPMQLVTETFLLPVGFDAGQIMISATDSNENTSEFAFIDIANPVINLFGNGKIIEAGLLPEQANDTDYGRVAYAAGAIENTFVIQNNGVGPLNLTGKLAVTIDNIDGAFNITQQPASTILLPGETTSFSVSFDPTPGTGMSSAFIAIENDSRQNEVFIFELQGQGLASLAVSAIDFNIDEGQTLSVHASLDDTAINDVVLDYVITGAVTADDFTSGALSGSFTIDQGSKNAVLNLITVLDDTNEGIESFSMTITSANTDIVTNTPIVLNGTIEDSDIIFINGFE